MTQPTVPLIIGTYTESLAHVDGKAAGILGSAYAAGAVEPPSVLAPVRNPSWIALSPDGLCLYAVVETVEFEGSPGGGVAAFARDQATGALTPINAVPSGGVEPAHVAVHPDGAFVLVANYRTGSVSVFERRSDGGLGAMVEHVQHEGSSVHPVRQTGPHAHQIVVDPVTGRVLVPDLGLDAVLVYDFDGGRLRERRDARIVGEPGAGPRHLAFADGGEHLLLLNELDNTLVVLRREGDRFVRASSCSTLPEGHTGHSQASAIRVSPSGRYVFTSNRGHDSIAVLAFDAAASSARLVRVEPALGREPRDFVLAPDGEHLLVADQDSGTVVTFRWDEAAASLTPVSTVGVPTPVCLLFA